MGLIFIVLMIIFMAAMYLNLLKGAKKADIKLNKLSEEDGNIKLKEELKFGNYIICESNDGIEIKEI
ncbi:hypothetical protein JJB75_14425 [Clostridium perfringens]|uniref:hypothetical protein n=1 Tax=Clostridium perfringens TaxID=1502 RepID=UPI001ABA4F43|nr:hypothetical protein [Clostridium perfringens]MBO3304349.1 hypothetical protein [Clostridium perfringens]MBO3307669.1 hypothetical protein [Clostridium perfringens]MBO3311012.1 hypothetical protein [Clostridium perfringens]MBO3317303.1 hypothetical protein [Clostridium perfringens]